MNFEERHRLREERSNRLREVAPYVGNGERTGKRTAAPFGAELTRREREVLTGAIFGMTYAETSVWLGIGETTVKHYSQTMLAKLGAESVGHAVALHLERCGAEWDEVVA